MSNYTSLMLKSRLLTSHQAHLQDSPVTAGLTVLSARQLSALVPQCLLVPSPEATSDGQSTSVPAEGLPLPWQCPVWEGRCRRMWAQGKDSLGHLHFLPYHLWYCGNGAGGENLGKKILEPFCKPSQLCWSSHRVFCKTYSLAVKAALCQPPSSCCLLHA